MHGAGVLCMHACVWCVVCGVQSVMLSVGLRSRRRGRDRRRSPQSCWHRYVLCTTIAIWPHPGVPQACRHLFWVVETCRHHARVGTRLHAQTLTCARHSEGGSVLLLPRSAGLLSSLRTHAHNKYRVFARDMHSRLTWSRFCLIRRSPSASFHGNTGYP